MNTFIDIKTAGEVETVAVFNISWKKDTEVLILETLREKIQRGKSNKPAEARIFDITFFGPKEG